jgi:hypothetical protein
VQASFLIGAVVMGIGGVVELVLGINAEGKPLEELALPLTVADAAAPPDDRAESAAQARTTAQSASPEAEAEEQARQARIAARSERQRASQSGRRRYRPGPPPGWNSPWRESPAPGASETALDHEIETISNVVQEHNEMDVGQLHSAVGASILGSRRIPAGAANSTGREQDYTKRPPTGRPAGLARAIMTPGRVSRQTPGLACRIFGHRHAFYADGRTMRWHCARGCGQADGSKQYDTAEDAHRYPVAFNRRDTADLGKRAPLIGLLPLRLWRKFRGRQPK